MPDLSLLVFIGICIATAMTGILFKPGDWYKALEKPAWTTAGLAVRSGMECALSDDRRCRVAGLDDSRDVRAACPVGRESRFECHVVMAVLWHQTHGSCLCRRRDDCGWRSRPSSLLASATVPLAALLFVPYLVWVTIASALKPLGLAPQPAGRVTSSQAALLVLFRHGVDAPLAEAQAVQHRSLDVGGIDAGIFIHRIRPVDGR